MGEVSLKRADMRTVRCTSMEPASKNIPITTHTPTRTVDSTQLNGPHTNIAKGKLVYGSIELRHVHLARYENLKPQSHRIIVGGGSMVWGGVSFRLHVRIHCWIHVRAH